MVERAALAILMYVGASSWVAVGLAGACWLSSLVCLPYWSRAEDGLDTMVWLTTTFAYIAASLHEDNVVAGLVILIGPVRLMMGAYKWFKVKRRAAVVRGGHEAIEKMNEVGETPKIL